MNNQIKNTLFRFINMRAPELISNTANNAGFINQQSGHKGYFNEIVANLSVGSPKLSALQTAATNYSRVKTTEQLSALNTLLSDFSVWLSKNKDKATESEINIKATAINDTSLDLKLVWENLIYQALTQKDFYAKEVAMQLLVAHHVCTAQGSAKEKALAKVVLPAEIFLDSQQNTNVTSRISTINFEEVPFANNVLQTLEQKALAEEGNKLLEKLKAELINAEAMHKKNYEIEYASAFEIHQAKIKPLIDAYNKNVEDQRVKWCSSQDLTKATDPAHPCSQPPLIPFPDLPEFSFPYNDVINEKILSGLLSPEAFEIYKGITEPVTDEDDQGFQLTSRMIINNSSVLSENFNFSHLVHDKKYN
ncbi:hypothetical protein CHU92_11335 [Flavobacterium cyanobacteriorum]|uniref:Uncharacterized protein n=1 Tax=Flavobacterium cyanobacteriorum TaxID=2022802 RepID=A0A255Z318_9FLAO|nr:hypothetical protein [Flavobacterium cyanobacteriorum]OYQ35050.1 hypothetical protein CHU92_11335 [Flavobacterium cyanobacteriorum]